MVLTTKIFHTNIYCSKFYENNYFLSGRGNAIFCIISVSYLQKINCYTLEIHDSQEFSTFFSAEDN